MKTLLLTLIFVSGSLFANTNANTDWVDKQIEAIKPPRTGISHAAINRVKNPFIFVYKKTEGTATASKTAKAVDPKKAAALAARKGPLKLAAVMNNSALINGSWYQVNDKVRGYTLAKIETDAVLLKTARTKKMLFITEENPNIKIQVK